MDASLMPYCQGAIVWYEPPYTTEDIHKYRLYPKHPVMIASKNFSETTFEYMVFPITSKIERYCGYRIFMNASSGDGFMGKMSVIRTDVIERIDRSYIGNCFGYAPPELVKKCLNAFAWHIGMTTIKPDYVQNDPRRLEYYEAGEPNVTHDIRRIEGDVACHGYRADPETGLPRLLSSREFKTAKPAPRTTHPIIAPKAPVEEKQEETVEEPEKDTPAPPRKTKTLDIPARTLREEIDSIVMPDEMLAANAKFTSTQSAVRRNRIAANEYDVNLSNIMGEIRKLSVDDRFNIYVAKITEAAMQTKYGMTRYTAHKMRMAIITYITKYIEMTARDMRNFSKDCKYFVSDDEILALRCMLPHELKYARASSSFYAKMIEERYELDYATQTTLGLIEGELKKAGKTLPTF